MLRVEARSISFSRRAHFDGPPPSETFHWQAAALADGEGFLKRQDPDIWDLKVEA